mmetsp:Transcript_16513/g.41203  ORF Transcript_16513/g.41203 Transcript_16513/m.41203 type:complete len:213 (-) Transcript_16513:785-1423(-)
MTSPLPAVMASTPSSRAASTTGPAMMSSCTPHSRPTPRTSFTCGFWPMVRRSPERRRCPLASTDARNAGSAMTSNTVHAAWHTSGLPANVEPWSPGRITSATCCFMSTAPMGRPPASGLASVIMSGATPYSSWPHSLPVRPSPHCTSSNTSSAPASSHSLRRPARNSFCAGVTPPSPCTGSTNTAAVRPLTITFRADSRSLYSASWWPGIMG